jgi:lactoylglutathione lyase
VSDPIVFNHVGHCVGDIARARRFYEALGFVFDRDLTVPDDPTGKLLRVDPPVGLSAVYLRSGGFVLELLHYDRPGNPPPEVRAMNEPGLTHLSVTVADLPGTLETLANLGAEVLEDTHNGVAVFVRDPDGQLVELIAKH